MKKCTHCFQELKDDSENCPDCGALNPSLHTDPFPEENYGVFRRHRYCLICGTRNLLQRLEHYCFEETTGRSRSFAHVICPNKQTNRDNHTLRTEDGYGRITIYDEDAEPGEKMRKPPVVDGRGWLTRLIDYPL